MLGLLGCVVLPPHLHQKFRGLRRNRWLVRKARLSLAEDVQPTLAMPGLHLSSREFAIGKQQIGLARESFLQKRYCRLIVARPANSGA